MERIDYVIAKFREDHPEMDADLLAEFAQHVRRVVSDDIREEMYDGQTPVAISLQVHGHAFSAKGPRSYVDELLGKFQESVSTVPATVSSRRVTPGFNRMQLISGRGK